MSMANPYMPASINNAELARDMRALALRLDDQSELFLVENVDGLACMVTADREFRAMARSLRILAAMVQPQE